ncbi:MAG: LysM peptidoglycan-binding domain-containing protein [Chloroflexota bacterium]|jgi:murein DD-endopeptidase MepM/ murein hydrolase activator NlpD
MKRLPFLALIVLAFLLFFVPQVDARQDDPTPVPEPTEQSQVVQNNAQIHVVQEGETLFSIAQLYGSTIEVLQQLNNIDDPSFLYVGQELILPGGNGEIVAAIHTIQVGDSLSDLALTYNSEVESLAVQNRLINPNYLVAGQSLTIINSGETGESQSSSGLAHVVQPGDSLLTIAAEYNLAPSEIVAMNDLSYPTYLYLGQRLHLPGSGQYQSLPGYWRQIRMFPTPLIQGQTAAVYAESTLPGTPEGNFAGQSLRFHPYEDGFLALVGLDAFTEPGFYTLDLKGSGDRPWPPFQQDIRVESGNYGIQYVTVPDSLSHLLVPEVRANEEVLLADIFTQVSERQWDGLFQYPVENSPISAGYGDARSYNDGPIEIFHTGIDFAGPIGTPIHSVAQGTVVFSETLPLHGSTIIVDHGLSVMTAYYHLSKSHVQVGEQVAPGQTIAEGGSTGLSSGPHLHWDLRVNNVPVSGFQWIETDLVDRVVPKKAVPASTDGEP